MTGTLAIALCCRRQQKERSADGRMRHGQEIGVCSNLLGVRKTKLTVPMMRCRRRSQVEPAARPLKGAFDGKRCYSIGVWPEPRKRDPAASAGHESSRFQTERHTGSVAFAERAQRQARHPGVLSRRLESGLR